MTEISRIFNIQVTDIKSLDGDINYSNIKYAITDNEGKKYILKIYPDKNELIQAKEETRILNKIGKTLSFSVPQTIETSDGQLFFQHEKGEAKLLSYTEGDFIANVHRTPQLLFSLGEKIAELDKALEKIESPVLASRRLFWDLQHAPFSYHKIELIREPEKRKLLYYFFDRFQHIVLPQLHQLRHSIIHGDLNDYNVLVKNGNIEGFLDFGDSTYTPLVNEPAIAMTYMMLDKENPFEHILPLIKGYQSIHPLTNLELELLPELITTRLCISLCNSAEKKQMGQDTEYVLISEKPAWELLEKWITVNPLKIKGLFLEAAGFKTENKQDKRNDLIAARTNMAGKSLRLSYSSPVYMTAAAFQYMYDEQGNTYLDAYNNIAHVGHCHPKVTGAIAHQSRILNTNTRYLNDLFTEYGSRLLQYFPAKLCKVFFVNSGSEASDLAIRMARTYVQRKGVIVLEHGYHGNTSTGIDISSYKFDGKGGKGNPAGILKLPLPNLYNGKFISGKEYAEDAIKSVREEIEKNKNPCALIAESISGCGGQVPLATGYLKALQPFLESFNIVTIIDEVQTGFGRLGKYFWGFEMHDIIPDIVILGKPMGNGHPIAAVVTTEVITDAFDNGMEFFSSFGGNPVSCACATSVLDVIEEERLQENANQVGSYFKNKLKELQQNHKSIGDVRGEGLFLGIEFTDPSGAPDTTTAAHVKDELKNNFILTGTDGPYNNVLKMKPPLCFNKFNVDFFVDQLDSLMKSRK